MKDKDTNDFIIALADNISFIRWVKSDFEEDDVYWSDFIDDNSEREDDINAAIRLVGLIEFTEQPHAIDTDALWNRISQSAGLEKGKLRVVKSTNLMKILGGVSTAVAACLLAFLIFRPGVDDIERYSVPNGSQSSFTLSDASEVMLNAASTMTFQTDKKKAKRHVELNGEAWFKVVKGGEFNVVTDHGSVSVLGTEFNVFSRDHKFEVTCYTGKVSVSFPGLEKSYLLTAGMGIRRLGDDVTSIDVDASKIDENWRTGLFRFENVAFSEVIAEFERQFGIKLIVPEGFRSKVYSGFFRNRSVEEAVMSLSWPMGLKYTINPDQIVLSEE